MANAVEEALNRANEQKRAIAEQRISEAEHKIESAKMQMGNSPSGDLSAIIANNEQVIADARNSIPVQTMMSVDSIEAPMNTPPMHGNVNSEQPSLNPMFKSQIESIEQSGGNNYLNQNAVDRAMDRPSLESPNLDQPTTLER